VFGGTVNYAASMKLAGMANDIKIGSLLRVDLLHLGRLPSEGRVALTPAQAGSDPVSFSNDDNVTLLALAAYAEATTHWTDRFRSVLGVRVDFQRGSDTDNLAALHALAGYTNGGVRSQALLQPKGSLIYAPTRGLELYVSAGQGFHSADLRGVNQDRSVDLGLPNTPLLARQVGEEVGIRGELRKNLTLTLALYNLWQRSETIIDPDVGQDTAGPPSRRYGYEINLTYQLNKWLEFYGSYSGDHTRFTQPFDDGTGHVGEFITDAPKATGSFALYLNHLGPWSAGLEFRYLGNYPLSSGPCNDAAAAKDFPDVATSCANAPTAPGQINGKGFGEVNLDVHYAFAKDWLASLGLYNVLNTHAAAAEFWYVDRLQNEITSYPDGRADIHEHPLEPRMLRVSLSRTF
jgi:outer membrane receptor protein involved in Fe transport